MKSHKLLYLIAFTIAYVLLRVNIAGAEEQENIYIHGENIHITTGKNGCVSINGTCISTNNTHQQFIDLEQQIGNARNEAYRAAAIGLAASSIRFDDRPGKLSLGFSAGSWRNKEAFAVGGGYTNQSGSIRTNITGAFSGRHAGVGVGASFTLN